jgi:hypothetical protein
MQVLMYRYCLYQGRAIITKGDTDVAEMYCPGRPWRSSGLSVSHSISVLYRGCGWARGALNSRKRRFPAWAVVCDGHVDVLPELGMPPIVKLGTGRGETYTFRGFT